MINKLIKVVSISVIGLVLVSLLLLFLSMNKKSGNAFIQAEKKQEITAELYINKSSLEQNRKHITILYKEGCPSCKRWSKPILKVLSKEDTKSVSFVEVTSGIPSYIIDAYRPEYTITPIVIVTEKDSNGKISVLFNEVVNNDKSLLTLKELVSE